MILFVLIKKLDERRTKKNSSIIYVIGFYKNYNRQAACVLFLGYAII